MSNDESRPPSRSLLAVLQEQVRAGRNRMDAHTARMERFEGRLDEFERTHTANLNNVIVELRVLQTRVGFLAAGIGTAAGVASSLIVVGLRAWLG